MAVRINFEPGPQQALEAGNYFTEVSADIVRTRLADMDPRQLLVLEKKRPPLPMRIWTRMNSVQEELQDVLPWLRQVAKDIRQLGRKGNVARAMELAAEWSNMHHAQPDIFLELLDPAHPFTTDENAELSLGIVGGETVMLSARNVMFAKLSNGLFGLTVAGLGSWLVERG